MIFLNYTISRCLHQYSEAPLELWCSTRACPPIFYTFLTIMVLPSGWFVAPPCHFKPAFYFSHGCRLVIDCLFNSLMCVVLCRQLHWYSFCCQQILHQFLCFKLLSRQSCLNYLLICRRKTWACPREGTHVPL